MVEFRHDKIQVLHRWLNQDVTVEGTQSGKPFFNDPYTFMALEWSVGMHQATLEAVNMHWVTFNVHTSTSHRFLKSEPMEKVMLSWDHEKKRLKVLIKNSSV